MSTDKLLRAFIEASGYEVKEVQGDFITTQYGGYSEFDYKVTKKQSYVPIEIQSKEWGCIVDFVQSHREDIINDVNDYGGLGFILDFMERNSNE